MRGRDRLVGWAGPLAVALLALVLRVRDLGRPRVFVFDETYYAKDAYSLLQHGYVQDFVEDANARILASDLAGVMTGLPSQIAHPDGGKWVIALGIRLFGMDPFGWRIAVAVAGTLTVLVLARLVRRLTGSTWVGCLAGLLLALDGMHLVMSRTALLDVVLVLWLVSAVACLVADRDWVRERLDRHRYVRPWQLAAGVFFGLACGTKWSGVYVLAGFGLLVVAWEVLARRGPWLRTTLAVGAPAFVSLVVVAFLVYLSTWTGWLLNHELYAERFGSGTGTDRSWGASPGPLRSLWEFHRLTFEFHTGDYLAGKTHPYASNPVGWLVLDRPVAFDSMADVAASRCGAPAGSSCIREVVALGNPAIWWPGAVALLLAPFAWLATRDGRWAVPVVGVATTWLPWFASADRPIFSFYSVATLPFTIIALCLLVDLGRRRAESVRARGVLAGAVGTLVVAVVALFVFFHPVLTGVLMPYDSWYDRMWFDRWI